MSNVTVTVKSNSKKGPFIENADENSLIVYIREVAADGKANDALIALLAKYYKVPKSHITIIRGHTSHHKVINIE